MSRTPRRAVFFGVMILASAVMIPLRAQAAPPATPPVSPVTPASTAEATTPALPAFPASAGTRQTAQPVAQPRALVAPSAAVHAAVGCSRRHHRSEDTT